MRYLCPVAAPFPQFLAAPRAVLLACIALGVLSGVACKDISRFSTGPGESFCGSIIPASFLRQGFGPGVRMRLTLDTDHLDDAPGVIVTDDGKLDSAPLRPIPQLAHDALSTLNFGEGRERNLLFGISTIDGPQALAVVSLLENGDIEVRVLRGSALLPGELPPPTDGDQLYGVFPLQRQQGTCGF